MPNAPVMNIQCDQSSKVQRHGFLSRIVQTVNLIADLIFRIGSREEPALRSK